MVEMRLVTAGGTVDTTSLPDRRWELYGKTVHDCDGNPVGIVAAIYVDDDTDRPMWAAVRPSCNGPAPLVPLCRATVASDGSLDVQLPAAILLVAPAVGDADAELDLAFEDALFAHYASAFSSHPDRPAAGILRRNGRHVAARSAFGAVPLSEPLAVAIIQAPRHVPSHRHSTLHDPAARREQPVEVVRRVVVPGL